MTENDKQLKENFTRLKDAVFAKRPVLKEILDNHGSDSLYDYAQDYLDVNISSQLLNRQGEFLATFHNKVENLLGKDVAESAVRQLKKYYFVSTADHHGPLCHPFFLSSNLINAVIALEKNDEALRNVIVLACGSVSLDNSSFPRGLVLNAVKLHKIEMRRLAFFSSHERPALVGLLRSLGQEEIKKFRDAAWNLYRADDITKQDYDNIVGIVEQIYSNPDIQSCKSFSEQITKSNFLLWKMFFKHGNFPVAPNLIYLELEDIVSELIVDHHLFSDTIISRLFFDDKYRSLLYKHFDNILGAFSTGEKWGTYLFWAVPKGERYRIQLWNKGDMLISQDGKYQLKLTPQALHDALKKKEIIPSLMLDFIILSFYYGIKCLGGFSQVNYLTFMKDAYQKMIEECGGSEKDICNEVQTKELVGDLTVAYLKGHLGEFIPATGLDLILYGNGSTWKTLSEEVKWIKLGEALDPMMPEFYRIIYPDSERDLELMKISAEDITKLIRLNDKINPCVSF